MVYFYGMMKFQTSALNLENECFHFTPGSIFFLAGTTCVCLSFNTSRVKNHFERICFTLKIVNRDVVNTKST